MRAKTKALAAQAFAILAALAIVFGTIPMPTAAQSNVSFIAGEREAQQFAYGWGAMPGAHVVIGNSATGAQTVLLCPAFRATGDGREVQIFPTQGFAPVTFDAGTATSETITPTAVSIVTPPSGVEANQSCASVTATFSFTHFASQNTGQVRSGTFGLQESIDDAGRAGGVVTVDNTWGGTTAMIVAATEFPNVVIADKRFGGLQYWTPVGAAALMVAPAILTNATAGFGVNGANFTSGFWTGSATYIACYTLVDIMGQESPCSPSFTIATSGVATTDQIGFTSPVAAQGAVGWKPYITLTGGPYTNAYAVPIVTQPTVVGAAPVGNGVCVLTTLEGTTPACALPNTTYAQGGSGAVVSALTVNTSQIIPQSGIVSTTSVYVPNPGGRTSYVYTPGSRIAVPGMPTSSLVFTTAGSAATTVPTVIGTINVPPQLMNFVGRTLEVCGKYTVASTTSTIVNIQFQWDANGQNTAGKGVQIGTLGLTPATGFATTEEGTFCEDFNDTVAGVTATAGSMNTIGGFIATAGVTTAAAGQGAGTDPTTGATAALNLADAARINVIYLHTSAGASETPVLQALTAKVIN
jgi:hypothetical protein